METVIYLDTHVVAWLYAGDTSLLSEHAQQLIRVHGLRISPMVRLELQYLHEIGRAHMPASQVIASLQQAIDLAICNLPFHEVIGVAETLTWTRDPFDRIIVGQAAVHGNVLVTKDKNILAHYNRAAW